jgi:hypothetical protein
MAEGALAAKLCVHDEVNFERMASMHCVLMAGGVAVGMK